MYITETILQELITLSSVFVLSQPPEIIALLEKFPSDIPVIDFNVNINALILWGETFSMACIDTVWKKADICYNITAHSGLS